MAIQVQRDIGFNLAGWRVLVDAVFQLVEGRHNASDTFTLTPGATTTTVAHPNCSKACCPQIGSPRTANAAAAASTTYVSAINQGSFVVTHANNAQVDRTFGYTVTGG